MARGHWGWSPHIKGSRKLVEHEAGERTMSETYDIPEEVQAVDRMTATIARLEAQNADLLAALKVALPVLRLAHDTGYDEAAAFDAARAAIEKAS